MLIIFGMSLHGLSVRPGVGDRVPTTVAVILKSAVQPVVAWVLTTRKTHDGGTHASAAVEP
jgi:hypothetical protein